MHSENILQLIMHIHSMYPKNIYKMSENFHLGYKHYPLNLNIILEEVINVC